MMKKRLKSRDSCC